MELAKPSNTFEEGIVENIKTHGYQFNVISDPDEVDPVFVYTVGLWETFGHPELITIGLHHKMASQIFSEIYGSLKRGDPHYKADEIRSDFISGFDCKLIMASPLLFEDYLLSAVWRYKGSEFPVLQIVFQDANHLWPWDDQASEEFVKDQPVLGEVS